MVTSIVILIISVNVNFKFSSLELLRKIILGEPNEKKNDNYYCNHSGGVLKLS